VYDVAEEMVSMEVFDSPRLIAGTRVNSGSEGLVKAGGGGSGLDMLFLAFANQTTRPAGVWMESSDWGSVEGVAILSAQKQNVREEGGEGGDDYKKD
jgi:hypothetical protein